MTTRSQCQFWDCNATIRRDYFLCPKHYPGYQQGLINQCPACGKYKDADYDVCHNCYRQTASAWSSAGSNAGRGGDYPDGALLEELRDLRRALARVSQVQDFMVFSNDTLEEMATIRPTTPEEMLAIRGVGPAKIEQFGPDFLRVIRERAGASSRQENRQPPPRSNAAQRDNREFAADKDADRFFVYILLLNNGEYYIGQTRELLERSHEHRNNMSQSTAGSEPKLQWFTTVATRREAADLEAELQQLNSNPAGRREINRWV